MAVQRQVGSQTDCLESNADLRGKEHRFCKRVAGNKVDICGAGGKAAGVISEGKNVGEHTSFNTGNQLKVLASAAIAIDARVASTADGRAVTAGAGNEINARAITAATAAGELITVDFRPEGLAV